MSIIKDKWTNTIYIFSNKCFNIKDQINNTTKTIVKIGSTKCLHAFYYEFNNNLPIGTKLLAYYHIKNYNSFALDDDIFLEFNKFNFNLDDNNGFYFEEVINYIEDFMKSKNIDFDKYNTINDFPKNNISMMKLYVNDLEEKQNYKKNLVVKL
jgi:hypothetical protein